MKRLKVRVKSKIPTKEDIYKHGHRKAAVGIEDAKKGVFTISVVEFLGRNYFVVVYGENVVECLEV